MGHYKIQETMEGLSRIYGKPSIQKQKMTKVLLISILQLFWNKSLEFSRGALLEFTMFQGLARFSDVNELTWRQVEISSTSVVISLEKRKNDQHKKGHKITLASNASSPWCPIKLFSTWRSVSEQHSPFVFSKIQNSRILQIPASYDTIRNLQKFMLEKAGEEAKKFGLHSGRIGGQCTLASAGVDQETIRRKAGYARGSTMVAHYTLQADLASKKASKVLKL